MEKQQEMYSAEAVAACGLYCGACNKYRNAKCPGCRDNEKAQWCKIRSCCIENGYRSCADCTIMPLEECKKFNNLVGKVFALIFRSDRDACVRRIREIGYDEYARQMHISGQMTMKKQGWFRK